MMRLFDRTRLRTTTDSHKKTRPRRFQPRSEKLDERIMPAITFHGGPVIAHVEVSNVFYGQAWNASDPSGAGRGALNQFQADITQSAYMAMLGQYGVGRGKFVGSDNVTGPSSAPNGVSINDSVIQTMLTQEIKSGRLPDENGKQLYFVYLAPNLTSQWDVANQDVSHHGSFTMVEFRGFSPIVNETITYAVVENPVGTPAFNPT
jgi:hypothetical protein